MDTTMLELVEELLQAIEQRDAADPDAPAWEAAIRIQRLEETLSRRVAGTATGESSQTPEPMDPEPMDPEPSNEALVAAL
jgi:hypothetical protein